MNSIVVPRIASEKELQDIGHMSCFLDTFGDQHKLGFDNWHTLNYSLKAGFKIACSDHSFLLKYYVSEKHIRAINIETNGPVYQDSCVEFFIMPDPEGAYFNFEFNCIGTCLAQKGRSRNNREFLSPEDINKIQRKPSLSSKDIHNEQSEYIWELCIMIPYEIFNTTNIIPAKDKILYANFYKCGDLLPEPHYLSWNRIKTEKPDFHRPEFFGLLKFE